MNKETRNSIIEEIQKLIEQEIEEWRKVKGTEEAYIWGATSSLAILGRERLEELKK